MKEGAIIAGRGSRRNGTHGRDLGLLYLGALDVQMCDSVFIPCTDIVITTVFKKSLYRVEYMSSLYVLFTDTSSQE